MTIRSSRQLIRYALAISGVLVTMAVVAVSAGPGSKAVEPKATSEVRLTLERLPRYGVFDFLAFRFARGAVTLEGYAYGPWLKSDAIDAVKRLPGVDDVSDMVEILLASRTDDRIRWITFLQIYTDRALERYAPWGANGARFDTFQYRRRSRHAALRLSHSHHRQGRAHDARRCGR